MIPLGQKIALRRRERGMTQHQLAARVGLAQANLSNIERGKQDLTVGTLRLLAHALEIPVVDFFKESEERWSRARLEALAAAVAGIGKARPEDAQLVQWFRAILPQPSSRGSLRRIQNAWAHLRERLSRQEVDVILGRVRDAQMRKAA